MKQIDDELYDLLCQYFLEWQNDEEYARELYSKIVYRLRDKQDKVQNRKNFTGIMKAATEEERIAAIDRYCDERGVPKDFRFYDREGNL